MATKRQLNEIIDYLLTEQYVKLNVPTLIKLLKIDKDFDFNKFEIKRIPMTIMYSRDSVYDYKTRKTIKIGDLELREMNTGNCFEEKVYDMTGFRINGKEKIETDLNIFFRNLDKVTSIHQQKLVDYRKKIYSTAEYQVKYLSVKNNIKTFRFVLHSYTKRAHNLKVMETTWRKLEEYYINGNSIDEKLWKQYSREYKLKRILKNERD